MPNPVPGKGHLGREVALPKRSVFIGEPTSTVPPTYLFTIKSKKVVGGSLRNGVTGGTAALLDKNNTLYNPP